MSTPGARSAHVLVADSGLGGLSVVAEIRKRLPAVRLSYLADYALYPYGTREEAEILAHLPNALAAAEAALSPDLVVVACNTASTLALTEIRARLRVPVVGTVPAIRPAGRLSQTRTIGLLGTPGTVRRRYTEELIRQFAADCTVLRHGSARLVAAAEEKLLSGAAPPDVVAQELHGLFAAPGGSNIDVVVLACTHFPFLADELSAIAPRPVRFIDSGEAIARRVDELLTPIASASRAVADRAFVTALPDDESRLRAVFAKFGFAGVDLLIPNGNAGIRVDAPKGE